MYYVQMGKPSILTSHEPNVIDFVNTRTDRAYLLLANALDPNIKHMDDYPQGNPKRQFIFVACDDSPLNRDSLRSLLSADLHNPQHLLYLVPTAKRYTLRLFIYTDVLLNKSEYLTQCRSISEQANVALSPDSLKINKPIAMDPIDPADVLSFNNTSAPLAISTLLNNKSVKLSPDDTRLLAATDLFLKEPNAQPILSDPQAFEQLIDAMCTSTISGMTTTSFVYGALQKFANVTNEPVGNYHTLYQARFAKLTAHPELREQAPPLGNYIHLYALASNATNISQQLKASLPDGVDEDPEYTLAEAGDFIEINYPPYLLKQHGSDIENLVIYNAATGIWTQDRDIMYALLTAIRPYTSRPQFENFLATFAAKARNAGRIIVPYTGSRYIVFKNGVLDVSSMRLIPLSDPMIRGMNFTERSVLSIDWVDNPAVPVFEGRRQIDNGPWNPKDFIYAYGNNDYRDTDTSISRVTYFLFGLALGLFGGHNFGVHFDIQGESRWGKTTLSEIFNALYDYRTVTISFSALNGQFPFTSYPANTSVIWIKECNEGIDPLDDENGTVIYDGLADNQVRLQVKNKGDLVLSNPPQVFIDGTQFLQAKEIYTGPAGRTLAYKLPTMDKAGKLRAQAYSSSILECLQDERTLQWLVWAMLEAYRRVVPNDRIDDLKINLSNKTDLALFPKFSIEWRREFARSGSTIDEWFDEEFVPYLCADPTRPTLIHKFLIYEMYADFYSRNHPDDLAKRYINKLDSVMSRFNTLCQTNDLVYEICEDASATTGNRNPRKQVKDYTRINFDWNGFEANTAIPESIKGAISDQMQLFGKRVIGWHYIYPEALSDTIKANIK